MFKSKRESKRKHLQKNMMNGGKNSGVLCKLNKDDLITLDISIYMNNIKLLDKNTENLLFSNKEIVDIFAKFILFIKNTIKKIEKNITIYIEIEILSMYCNMYIFFQGYKIFVNENKKIFFIDPFVLQKFYLLLENSFDTNKIFENIMIKYKQSQIKFFENDETQIFESIRTQEGAVKNISELNNTFLYDINVIEYKFINLYFIEVKIKNNTSGEYLFSFYTNTYNFNKIFNMDALNKIYGKDLIEYDDWFYLKNEEYSNVDKKYAEFCGKTKQCILHNKDCDINKTEFTIELSQNDILSYKLDKLNFNMVKKYIMLILYVPNNNAICDDFLNRFELSFVEIISLFNFFSIYYSITALTQIGNYIVEYLKNNPLEYFSIISNIYKMEYKSKNNPLLIIYITFYKYVIKNIKDTDTLKKIYDTNLFSAVKYISIKMHDENGEITNEKEEIVNIDRNLKMEIEKEKRNPFYPNYDRFFDYKRLLKHPFI